MQKPIWMWSTREELEGDILFVDADTIFHQNPRESLAKVKGDIGLFLNANGPVSSAVFVRDTERGTCFLRLWKNACEEILSNEIADDLNSLNPEKSDQDVLKHLINKYGQDLFWADFGVQALPTEMCFIYGSSEWNIPKKQVVLEHLQASRTLRREFRPLARRQMRIAVLHFKFLTRLFARKRNKPGV